MAQSIFLSRSIFSATFRRLKVPSVKFSDVNKQLPSALCSASLKKAMAAEDWLTALCLIEQVVEDKEIKFTNEQMSSAFEACEKTRHGDLIVRLLETKFDDIKKHQTNSKLYVNIFKLLLLLLLLFSPFSNSLVRALKVSFESDGDPLTKLQLVQRVLKIFETKKIYLDKFGLARALGFCVKACNSEAALKMLESFANVADIVCFNVAISACASEGRSSQALLLLSRMRERGLNPDSVSYNAVILAFLKVIFK
jgi:pentatricopeptide repeat protein